MVYQQLYTCRTCHLLNGECICEACAKKCHNGHDVFSLGYNNGYCDCGAGNIAQHCMCNKGIFSNSVGSCTINTFGKKFAIQPFFRCLTCKFSFDEGCCEFCAKSCHLGHTLIYLGKFPSLCLCGISNPRCKFINVPQ